MRIIFEGGEVLDLKNINKIIIESREEKEVIINAQLDKLKEELQEKYCDRNICIQNEYNGIGCDECEVTKSQKQKFRL